MIITPQTYFSFPNLTNYTLREIVTYTSSQITCIRYIHDLTDKQKIFWYSRHAAAFTRCTKYWFKLLSMSQEQCYDMLVELDAVGI